MISTDLYQKKSKRGRRKTRKIEEQVRGTTPEEDGAAAHICCSDGIPAGGGARFKAQTINIHQKATKDETKTSRNAIVITAVAVIGQVRRLVAGWPLAD